MEIQGFGYASYWNGQFAKPASDLSLDELAKTGANALSISSTWFTDTLNSSGITAGSDTESNANVALAIADAHARHLQVILKPHLDPASGEWRGLYAPSSAGDWLASYKNWIVDQALLAEANGAEALVLGTELESMAGKAYRAEWQDIIAAVREVYHGQLTYSAVMERASQVCFWDLLDYASVTAYPSAGSDGGLSPGQVEESWIAGDSYWHSPVEMLAALQQSTGKDVLISETGYRSVNGAIRDPGSYFGRGYVDIAEQLAGYQGLLGALSALDGRPWFKGVLLWKWDPVPLPSVAYAVNNYSNNDYSVQERPQALAEISACFAGNTTAQRKLLIGGASADALTGSARADVIAGRSGNDSLYGGTGADRLSGGLGNDWIDGGPGNDTVSFLGEVVAVTVALGDAGAKGMATGLGSDTLVGIENVFGGDKNDKLSGNAGPNSLWGSAGADQLFALAGADMLLGGPGADTLDGGLGIDTASYEGALSAVVVKLGIGAASGSATGGAGNDSLLAIENLIGSNYHDRLTGNGAKNTLNGGAGNDSLVGGAGDDLLIGGPGKDLLSGGTGSDRFACDSPLSASSNLDAINDFQIGVDQIQLENAVFSPLTATGVLASDFFAANATGSALRSSDYIVYNTLSGLLSYDADGSGPGVSVAFVQLTGVPALSSGDLSVI